MNNIITSPQGLDFEIQKYQIELYDELIKVWGNKIDGYGRSYYIDKDGIKTPQSFVEGLDYSQNLLEENNKFFFVKHSDSDRIENSSRYKCDVGLYFILDLTDIKPTITHRATQEVQLDVMTIVDDLGIENIQGISDYELSNTLRNFQRLYDAIKKYDTQPYHIFRVDLEIIYDLKPKCDG